VTGRSPARLLAPLALVITAVALFAVVTSGGGDGPGAASSSPTPTATATPAAERTRDRKPKTYTVKPGDTPSGIAAATGVDVDALLRANPGVDPNALTVGEKLELP
jgi:LysM repeat protein